MKVANYGGTSQERMEREQKMNEKLIPSDRIYGGGSKSQEKVRKSDMNLCELEA